MYTVTEPYHADLGDGLAMRSLASPDDVERLATFNGAIHDQGVADMTRQLVLHHPHTRPEHWLFVEDQATGQIVSSLCLIPWRWRYEDVQLKAGEMGIVGTLPAYRHRGLIRAQAARHAELLREGGYDLSHIQGIPYFYRQFGYEYAIPLEGGWRLELYLMPDEATDRPSGYTFRQATVSDLPALAELYDRFAWDLSISALRDQAEWRYLLGPSTRTEMVAKTWLILDAEQQPIAYFRVPEHGFGEGLIVNEASRLDRGAAAATLGKLKTLSVEQDKPYLHVCLPAQHALTQTARYRGAHDLGHYAWQIRLTDLAGLLRKLAPLLERRLAASPLAGLTQSLCLNLYRQAFELRFEAGQLAAVEALGFSDRGGIRIPPLLVAPLILGYRSREELMQVHHDVSVGVEARHLVDVLFPKVQSFIYTIY